MRKEAVTHRSKVQAERKAIIKQDTVKYFRKQKRRDDRIDKYGRKGFEFGKS